MMNDKEAIQAIRNYNFDLRQPGAFIMYEAIDVVEKAMQELQQYRELGTVKELEAVKKLPRGKQWTADMIEQVEKLHNNTPEGQIVDADTILVDLVQTCDHEFTGFALDIFNIWKGSSDKKSVEQMFYEFADMEFDRFLMKCNEEITREPSGLHEKITDAEKKAGLREKGDKGPAPEIGR